MSYAWCQLVSRRHRRINPSLENEHRVIHEESYLLLQQPARIKTHIRIGNATLEYPTKVLGMALGRNPDFFVGAFNPNCSSRNCGFLVVAVKP